MRHFERDTRANLETKELEKEAEARVRRNKGQGSTTARPASLGVFTIKFHYLGDYTHIIREFGTSDSYSTQIVSQARHMAVNSYRSPHLRYRANYTIGPQNPGILERTRKTTPLNFLESNAVRPGFLRFGTS